MLINIVCKLVNSTRCTILCIYATNIICSPVIAEHKTNNNANTFRYANNKKKVNWLFGIFWGPYMKKEGEKRFVECVVLYANDVRNSSTYLFYQRLMHLWMNVSC